MCIAMLTLPGAVVPKDRLVRYFGRNRDGGGFAYIHPRTGEVEIEKGFFRVGEFIEAYDKMIERGVHQNHPMLIHARIATMGKVNRDNCHPFRIRNGALIHNGSLFSDYSGRESERSDTRIFAAQLHNILTYEEVKQNIKRVSDAVGSYNKVAMLYDGGDYLILNEDKGTWHERVWYSNAYDIHPPTTRYSEYSRYGN